MGDCGPVPVIQSLGMITIGLIVQNGRSCGYRARTEDGRLQCYWFAGYAAAHQGTDDGHRLKYTSVIVGIG